MDYCKTSDGSFSLYNREYKDYYHSLKDGAILESLYKHIIPTFNLQNIKEGLNILDICFGLGYNSFFSLLYAKRYNFSINIYSVEKDIALLQKLKYFKYPKILQNNFSLPLLLESKIFYFSDSTLRIFIGDALSYIKKLKLDSFDIIYQDAFSPSKNDELWSNDYFKTLFLLLKDNGVISTYTSSKKIRNICMNCGFNVYDMRCGTLKNGTILSKQNLKSDKIDCISLYKIT
ncbi:tRNA (5-methylaminomethyl-2-thiouridine)(34)-methyltransferase MnmD [Helicobacter sp. MIT 14-3879]|uniref:tRNA (5-methylaminomethyl-2-thiouridine)(34)-methyltransferase MnmD n=1 Tax=Helicobacter sp. MIT 14-3879 TaxID=2040649 RepID=UPI0015F16E21|nr:MnmC family methyltransferase [Helicobacter sp. MIT 14-3879]